ncbi:phosphatase PAP2 family protein [Komagataeibacter sp. FNDCR2]|uniref:phosphatase PAP2 family protein n=1 Tax=Komagataeibacter sp. FNDCR2 TaxID=2878682 RepID=UPI001E3DC933|nr:phosphatase PAP2 family protein [Komagataeibacter sp. FNDCR2]MCE2575147.1 phosphatase PAP2 family protein [Komagataeibacter sp. FNDCR2]
MIRFITDFADQGDILPVVATVTAVMVWREWRRGASVWLGTVVLTLALMLVLKIVGLCYAVSMQAPVFSPSGHVASACLVYGSLLIMMGREAFIGLPTLTMVPLMFVAAVMAYTRLVLHAHSVSEVITGAMIGSIAAVVLGFKCGPVPKALWLYLLPAVVGSAFLFHGRHLGAEVAIRHLVLSEGSSVSHFVYRMLV